MRIHTHYTHALYTIHTHTTLTLHIRSGAYKYAMLYTFDYSLEQLDRAQDYVLDRYNIARIIHLHLDDLLDHYITLIDCDPATATLLNLL